MNSETYILRPLMVVGGSFGFFSGIYHIFANLTYTKTVLCIYISIFSLVIITSALSARVQTFFAPVFPFLSENLHKGIFLILLSFLFFGSELETSGILAGISLLICGCGYLAYELTYVPPQLNKAGSSNYEPPDIL